MMTDPNTGLEIKNRKYRLRTFENCFVGKDAVDWMKKQFGLHTEDAVALGQLLANRGVLHHVLDSHFFENKNYLYRFYKVTA